MLLGLAFLCLVAFQPSSACEGKSNLSCPLKPEGGKCLRRNLTVFCCNISTEYELGKKLDHYSGTSGEFHLHLHNVSLNSLHATSLIWKRLKSITITDSKIKKIIGKFEGDVKCISLSGNELIYINNEAFTSLRNLTILNLSKNNITNVPRILPSQTKDKNITLDISGNSQIRCHSISDLLDGLQNYSNHLNFINDNATFCLSSQSFNWFNSTDQVPLGQLLMLRKLQLEQQCPKGPTFKCHCSPFRVDFMPGEFLKYNAKVDCSGQQLTELPLNLPPNTKLLNVSNNNITSLNHLGRQSYEGIREIYADNNQIKSIAELEGSNFINNIINNLSVLSLRGNKLTSVPTYFLSNVFKNGRVSNVKLGGNRLHCDCNAAQQLKVWLMTNKEFIPDYEEVLCAADLEKVIFLDQTKLCIYKKEWTDYIYYIIAGEILLLVFLISKVFYDYWVFKTTGYLPWPASKMPKLPCDWVFES